MGLSNQISLLVDILRSVDNGHTSSITIVDFLSQRPLILRDDIIGLIPLAIKLCFLKEDEKNLSITQSGLDFMYYVDSISEKTSLISNPMEEDYSTLDKTIKEITEKYEKINTDVYDDLMKIRKDISEKISFAPELTEDYETLLTVSMPPSSEEKIPLNLKHQVMYHGESIEKVIQNASNILLVSTYTLDVPTFIQLVTNLNTKRLECMLIIGDAKKLVSDKTDFQFSIAFLKQFLNVHFKKFEVREVRELQKGFVSHAKVWLSEKGVLITSANIAINSNSDNFEAGIYTTRKDLIDSCSIMMKKVWDLGVPL